MPLTKADLVDSDIVDAVELLSDGTTTYLTVTVVSTTSGTSTVVVNLAADGEGILYGYDHAVEAGDRVVISGTSGGFGNGTFTVATVISDTSFTVVEAIGTSTGGSATFYYPVGSSRVGFDPTGLSGTTANNIQDALKGFDAAILLDVEPTFPNNNYALTRAGNIVTQERWRRIDTTLIKSIDYSYLQNKVVTEVRKVFALDGMTVLAQATLTYTYVNNAVTSYSWNRDV